ncbi:Sucrase/ferredoxin-like-domain-containing protein [Protomyces lactucae-debilis]|uniref:Sucrase/ferredoxin-like-domain-containing protein n=1 Tax=Protomyces lactucae-debilis TaxID=2754530 RepID=A0A1Y2FNH0_PROLT|nr:Sucrase/ferredoxin-like-domain-containing protein [Protomyces lactucae-debilis]ORY85541.1 Sucrase/ferredoxin-like-domain-containing protein [Protomyces lactucae-debilis]
MSRARLPRLLRPSSLTRHHPRRWTLKLLLQYARPASRTTCSCSAPSTLPAWPATHFPEPIDTTSHLTKIAKHERHLLVDTSHHAGAHDWPPYLPIDTTTSVAAAITSLLAKEERFLHKTTGRKILCNQITQTLHVPQPTVAERTKVLVMPDGIQLSIQPNEASSLLDAVLATTSASKDLLSLLKSKLPASAVTQIPHEALVMLCAHKQRDARCGLAAPVLQAHARHHLANRDIAYYYLDHMGGHKFAGNLVVYQQNGTPCAHTWHSVWYGRVHVDNIKHVLHQTLDQKDVVPELLRYTNR